MIDMASWDWSHAVLREDVLSSRGVVFVIIVVTGGRPAPTHKSILRGP